MLLHGKYVLHRLECSQKNDQLLCEGSERADSQGRRDSSHAGGFGPLDEDSPAAVDGRDGSYLVHRMDLRSSATARSGVEGGASAHAACHRCGPKEKRSHRCQQDRRPPALCFPAAVLHLLVGVLGPAPPAPTSQSPRPSSPTPPQ